MVRLLRELRRHGVGHQRWGMLLWSLCLGEGERGVTGAVLCGSLSGSELLSLEVVLGSERCLVITEVGLSVTVVAATAEAVGAAVTATIASILCICAKGFVWSVVKPSTIISVPKTAKIAPSRGIPITTIISIISTSASP